MDFFIVLCPKGVVVGKKIVITSGKGGVGKTTLTANLGKALASMGNRVVLIDVDFGLNNLEVVMGVENKVVYDLVDVFEGRCRLRQVLVEDNKRKNLYILPSGSRLSPEITGQNIKYMIESLVNSFDYILLDCPAGIDLGFHRAVSCADEAIVVVTPNIPSVKDADKVISILRSYKLDGLSLVVNRARGDLIIDKKSLNPIDIKSMLKVPLLGVLPEEDEVFLSSGYSLAKNSDSYRAYKILAENVHKKQNKIFNVLDKYTGFWGSIRRSVKRNI